MNQKPNPPLIGAVMGLNYTGIAVTLRFLLPTEGSDPVTVLCDPEGKSPLFHQPVLKKGAEIAKEIAPFIDGYCLVGGPIKLENNLASPAKLYLLQERRFDCPYVLIICAGQASIFPLMADITTNVTDPQQAVYSRQE